MSRIAEGRKGVSMKSKELTPPAKTQGPSVWDLDVLRWASIFV